MEERWNKMKDAMGATPPKPEDMAKRRMDRLTKDLDLDATQQKTVDGIATKVAPKAMMPNDMRTEWKKNLDGLLGDFEKDKFDAKKSDFYTQADKKGHNGVQNEVDFMSQLVPVLRPDQRDKLAAHLEHPPMMMGRGGPEGGMDGKTGFEKHYAGPWQDDDGKDMPPGAGMMGPGGMNPPPGGAMPGSGGAPAPTMAPTMAPKNP